MRFNVLCVFRASLLKLVEPILAPEGCQAAILGHEHVNNLTFPELFKVLGALEFCEAFPQPTATCAGSSHVLEENF